MCSAGRGRRCAHGGDGATMVDGLGTYTVQPQKNPVSVNPWHERFDGSPSLTEAPVSPGAVDWEAVLSTSPPGWYTAGLGTFDMMDGHTRGG